MSDKTKYLYYNKEIADVLSAGFAKICEQKPRFPINYLARFLKNHNIKKDQHTKMIDKLQHNKQIEALLKQKQTQQQQIVQKQIEKQKVKQMDQESFIQKIKQVQRHQQQLNAFCQWVADKFNFTGVYIGELVHQVKKINTNLEDLSDAHLELQKQKIIKFKYSSDAQHKIVVGRQLTLESVVGKLVTKVQGQENNAEQAQEGENAPQSKQVQVKGQVYFDSVVGNQQLKFFRFPKLGAFYAISVSIKSYLKEKLFDQNTIKVENYAKVLQDFEKQMQDKQVKFKEAYDEKANSGAQEKQLQDMEKQFEKEKSEIEKPQPENFESYQRKYVLCMDTLGLDKTISERQKTQIRQFVRVLKQSWQKTQKQQLQSDIDRQLKLLHPPVEQGGEQAPNYLQQYNNLIEEEQKQIPSNQEVDRVKDNQKLYELQMNTVRIQKTKQYLIDQKYLVFWDHLLELNVVKYTIVFKQLLILLGYKKNQFCFKGTNQLDWQKTKRLLQSDRSKIFDSLATLNCRGSKPQKVESYAKCARIIKNLESLQPVTIVTYNIYLAFILRIVQLYAKTRAQDRQARLLNIQSERQKREQLIKQAEQKLAEKTQKLQTVKAEAQQKGEPLNQEALQAWNAQYDQENPAIVIPDQIKDQFDLDLEQVDAQVEGGQQGVKQKVEE